MINQAIFYDIITHTHTYKYASRMDHEGNQGSRRKEGLWNEPERSFIKKAARKRALY